MGVALVLAPDGTAEAAQARLAVELLPLVQAGPLTRCRGRALEQLRTSLPAARALPLLEAIARGEPCRIVIPASPQMALRIRVEFE